MAKSLAIFVDVGNIFYCIGKRFEGKKLDYKKYLNKALTLNPDVPDELYKATAYGAQKDNEATAFITSLKYLGYECRYKKPKIFETATGPKEAKRALWDVGIAMDVVRIIDKVDTIILGSANPELVPLVEWIKEKGVKCVVIACGINRELKSIADIWIEIESDLLENRNEAPKENNYEQTTATE